MPDIAMTGIVALRFGKSLERDSERLKVRGATEADPLVQRPHRKKWL
jgi:hypothetical protein